MIVDKIVWVKEYRFDGDFCEIVTMQVADELIRKWLGHIRCLWHMYRLYHYNSGILFAFTSNLNNWFSLSIPNKCEYDRRLSSGSVFLLNAILSAETYYQHFKATVRSLEKGLRKHEYMKHSRKEELLDIIRKNESYKFVLRLRENVAHANILPFVVTLKHHQFVDDGEGKILNAELEVKLEPDFNALSGGRNPLTADEILRFRSEWKHRDIAHIMVNDLRRLFAKSYNILMKDFIDHFGIELNIDDLYISL